MIYKIMFDDVNVANVNKLVKNTKLMIGLYVYGLDIEIVRAILNELNRAYASRIATRFMKVDDFYIENRKNHWFEK